MYIAFGAIVLLFAIGWLIPLIMGIIRLKRGVRNAGAALTIIGGIWGFFAILFIGFGIYGYTLMSRSTEVEDFNPTSYQKPIGMINLSYKGNFRIILRHIDDTQLQRFKGNDGKVIVPANSYYPQSLDLLKKDKQGREWTASTYLATDINKIRVTTDSPVSINAGPPFEALASVDKSGNGDINIDLDLKDSDGRQYTLNCDEIEDPPGFVVLSKSGVKLWEGRFEAG